MQHQSPGAANSAAVWIGRPLKRREDLRFLQGRACYVDDIVLPDMAHLVIVRSTHAHACLRDMRLDAARQAPGVIAVVTAQDVATRLHSMPVNPLEGARIAPVPHPILAAETVRYAGEPVAAVLAGSRAEAVDAARLIEVDYDPLPVVIDPQEALAGKVLLHQTLGENILVRMTRGSGCTVISAWRVSMSGASWARACWTWEAKFRRVIGNSRCASRA